MQNCRELTTEDDHRNFYAWDAYFGKLMRDHDKANPSIIYGFENVSALNDDKNIGVTDPTGACFGFVQQGEALVSPLTVGGRFWRLTAGQFFMMPGGCQVTLGVASRVVVAQRIGYFGMNLAGGPIENLGRMRYIDGCSDTLLLGPIMKGEPCLNHLHFPAGIDQTEHTHPSSRIGMVASGKGECITPARTFQLEPGMLFYIPHDGLHKFRTLRGEHMNVIAYHPDSDFGPEHETHPMINRTLVDGHKMDNSIAAHQHDNYVKGFPAA